MCVWGGGSGLGKGGRLVGTFAYRLASGHWRVESAVAGRSVRLETRKVFEAEPPRPSDTHREGSKWLHNPYLLGGPHGGGRIEAAI